LRHLLDGDFYPLFPLPQSIRAWDGWQFHDPVSGEGFLVAFRVQAPEEQQGLRLAAVDLARRYRLTDPYTEAQELHDGAALQAGRLTVALPHGGSWLRHYAPLG